MEAKAPKPPRARKRHRLLKAFAILTLLIIALLAGLPSLLSTAPARHLILGKVNQRLAPGSASLNGLSISWTRPIELLGLSLRDPKGKVVVAARTIRLDRGVLGLLRSRTDYGTVTVEGATVDIERRADGSIDLLEALAPTLKSDDPSRPSRPSPSVAVVVKGGKLKLASPELVEPIEAASVEGTLRIAPGKPLEVAANLGGEGRSMELHATFDHQAPAGTSADLSLKAVGKNWPIHVREGGVEILGRIEGAVEAGRKGGEWAVQGEPALLAFEVFGPALEGDRLALDRLALACDVGQTQGGWSVRKLDIISAVASLSASGSWPTTGGAKLHGRVDLAALAKLMPHAMRLKEGLTLDKGTATIDAELTQSNGSEWVEISANLVDLAATQGGKPLALREPVQLLASSSRVGGKITIEKVELKAAGVALTARGDLDAGVKLQGTVDLALLDAQARDLLDLGDLAFSGRARVGADYRRGGDSFQARIAAEVQDLKVRGLTAEPILRDLVRLDGSASGPRLHDGMPAGWAEAKLDLKSGDQKLNLVATHQGDDLSLLASGGLDVTSPTPGRAEAKASVVLKGRVFEVQELRAGIVPSLPEAASGSVALAVRGRLDLASGEGHFTPLPGAPIGAVGLMGEGLRVTGLGQSGQPLRIEASMQGDLASTDRLLSAWSGTPPRGLGGIWGTQFRLSKSPQGEIHSDGQLDVADITAPGLRGPFLFAWKGGYAPEADRVEIVGINMNCEYGKMGMAGNLYEVSARKIYDLTASFEPDWNTIDPIVIASLEPGARLRGTFRPIHWKGYYQSDSTDQLLKQQVTEIALDVTEAKAFGVTLDPTAVVLKMNAGNAVFDPVHTKANGGEVNLVGSLALDQAYGVWLRLQSGTKVDGAEINDAVSTSVLAYIAPVLAQATQVSGKVSVDISQAVIPITADGAAAIQGQVVFQDAQFQAGPLGSEIAGLVGQPSPRLVLHQPVQLQVANRRVQQSGLEIPIVGDAKVGLDGSVGFDKSLDLQASVPLSSRMLGLDARFDKSVSGTRLAIPIRGTMSHPAIDRRGLAVAIREAAKKAVGNGLKAEAAGFLDRVAGPNPLGGEPKGKPGRINPLGELENLGRGLLDQRKP
ncbi:hypothetical protein P12x_002452 [Tundrisphaera lichenicola]|uniref:hypothetical protein n=1 Tax=Tundrisphaera lichenicola TaxID=2029860 RepID=UPI003EB88F95